MAKRAAQQATAEVVYTHGVDVPSSEEFRRRFIVPAISAVKARVPKGAALRSLEMPQWFDHLEFSEFRDGCRVFAAWIPTWSSAVNAGKWVLRVDVAWANHSD